MGSKSLLSVFYASGTYLLLIKSWREMRSFRIVMRAEMTLKNVSDDFRCSSIINA